MKLDFSKLSQKARGPVGTVGTQASAQLALSPSREVGVGTDGDRARACKARPHASPLDKGPLGKLKSNIDAVSPMSPVSPLKNKVGQAADAISMPGFPVADGPFLPYVAPLSPERVAALLADLRTTLDKLADLEGWTDGHLAHMLGLIARQPVSTLADDLTYFMHRLDEARAAELAAQTVSRVRLASGRI
ncbi:hypothetical protein ACI2S5_25940 [Ralstonia nicotianae]|uniref:hypothetical protein n=1 Tax=Ralstonia pseudosolanacearum TaxID=1310165 RepID=UPI00156FFB75|nr:hypothetical protein LG939_10550 [Ralstonia solanacearum]